MQRSGTWSVSAFYVSNVGTMCGVVHAEPALRQGNLVVSIAVLDVPFSNMTRRTFRLRDISNLFITISLQH